VDIADGIDALPGGHRRKRRVLVARKDLPKSLKHQKTRRSSNGNARRRKMGVRVAQITLSPR
jgi:hypothetical protein